MMYSGGWRGNVRHAARKGLAIDVLVETCRAWTYMLPILEEKPGESAA